MKKTVDCMCVWFVVNRIGVEGARALAEALNVNKTVHTIHVGGKCFQIVFFWVEFELNLIEFIVVVMVVCLKSVKCSWMWEVD